MATAMAQPPAQPEEPRTEGLTYQDIQFMLRGRHLLLGTTGSGKSTVLDLLIGSWVRDQANPRVLILDSKPRFRAEWELSGMSATHRYKRWRRGPVVPASVALDLTGHSGSIRAQLKQAWQLKHRVVIAQTGEQNDLQYLRAATHWFYADARDSFSQLLAVDELADFFGTSGAAGRGDSLLKVVRSGREMNVAFAGAAQRPKGLPHSFLTEVSASYIFSLASEKDMAHLEDLGLPGDATPPENDHVFYYHNKSSRKHGYAKMKLGERA